MCFKLATCADFTRPCISDFDELFSVHTKPTLVITWLPKMAVRWLRLWGFWDFRFQRTFRDFSQNFQRFQPEISRSEQPLLVMHVAACTCMYLNLKSKSRELSAHCFLLITHKWWLFLNEVAWAINTSSGTSYWELHRNGQIMLRPQAWVIPFW